MQIITKNFLNCRGLEFINKFRWIINTPKPKKNGGKQVFDPFNTPGLRYVGDISCERVNGGNPLPLFEPVATEGRCSINTLEGWNNLAAEGNRRSFISANGRKPENDVELKDWVDRMCRGVVITV